ncbi:MAG TPA: phage tail length tape measure family protein [Acidimicrobiales bacterium]
MAEGQQIGEAYVRIRPKSDGFEADAQRQIEDPLKRIAKGAAAAFAAVAVGGFLKGGIDELGEAQKAAAQTAAALKSTGGQANVTADQIDQLATSLANLSGADKEAVQGGANLLLTFRNVKNEVGDGNDIYNQALTLAQDLSVAYGQDLQGSVIQLGKALDNPIQGITALQRVGVTLSAQQKDQIKAFVEAGQTMEAQKVVLEELTKQVGGSAAAFGETLPGKLQRAQNAFDDLKGEVVAGAAPALEGLLDIVRPIVDVFSSLPGPVQAGVLGIGALAFVAPRVREGVSALSDTVSAARDRLGEIASRATGARGSLASFGSTAAGLAGPAAAFALAVTALAEASEKLGAATANYGSGSTERYLASLRSTADGQLVGKLSEDLNGLKSAIDDLESARSSDAVGILAPIYGKANSGAVDKAKKQIDELDRALKSLFAENPQQAAAAYQAVLSGLGIDADKGAKYFDDYTGAVEDAGLAQGDAANTGSDLAGSNTDVTSTTNDAADAMKAAEAASQAYADALKAQQDAAIDLVGGDIAARDAARDTAKALADLDEKRRSGTATADELSEAQDRVADAMLREADLAAQNAQKQAEANGQSFTAADSARVQREKLEELAGTLAPGSPLRTQLQGYIDQLNVVPSSIGTKAYLDLSQVEQQMVRLRELLGTDSAGGGFATRGGVADQGGVAGFLQALATQNYLNALDGKKASGGRVSAGGTYQVNEYGVEGLRTVDGTTLLTPGTDGTVIPTNQMPGGSTTWAPVFNISTSDPEKATRTALRLMRREAAYAGGR